MFVCFLSSVLILGVGRGTDSRLYFVGHCAPDLLNLHDLMDPKAYSVSDYTLWHITIEATAQRHQTQHCKLTGLMSGDSHHMVRDLYGHRD